MSGAEKDKAKGAEAGNLAQSEVNPVWEPRPGEPPMWYERFDAYRMLGPGRSLAAAYRSRSPIEGLRGKRPPTSWSETARNWSWKERAEAWDKAERERLRAIEADRRLAARERRFDKIDVMLDIVFRVMQQAALDQLTPEEARERLPMLRLFFKDLLNAHRTEMGLPADPERDGSFPPFTADDLIAAQRELKVWRRENRPDRLIEMDPSPDDKENT